MNYQINLASRRSRLARFSGKATKSYVGQLCLIVSLIVIGLFVFLLYEREASAWLLLIMLGPLLMFDGWRHGGLSDLAVDAKGDTVDGLLDQQLLAKLRPGQEITPKTLTEALMQLPAGHFYAVRFGIGPGFMSQLASQNKDDVSVALSIAAEYRNIYQTQHITSAMVLAGVIRSTPGIDQYLAHLQLSVEDIDSGVDWFEHIQKLIAAERDKHRQGGLGRDLTFGYTPLLTRFGQNITRQIEYSGLLVRETKGHAEVVRQMLQGMGSGGRQNISIVGPLGVGKTTLVYAFAKRLINPSQDVPKNLRYRQVFLLDPSRLISTASGRGELEQLVTQLIYEAHSARNIVLVLDGAELFFEDGVGSVNLSNLLLPILEAGNVRMLITMDDQKLLELSRSQPALTRSLNAITITPPDKAEVIRVLQDQLIMIEFGSKVTFMYQALLEAYRLGDRYMVDQAMPGKAMQLLEASARYANNGLVTAASVQQAIEQTNGVKVSIASNDEDRTRLLNLEDLIHQRMINQTRAVSVVSDALRRARAGVRNLDRPVGTFLFLGPTGVGKTELAKSVADIYFNGEDKLIRLDLNEFVQSSDVARLIADGATDSHSLSAKVAKQPFSVVLLDEIEKAHPDVLNTLLQVLDEGIMRDIRGREISFRDAIIIATSNAGADRIREHIEAGQQLEQFEEQFVSELINAQVFRPEFLNRFDDIVLFRPLTKNELLQVVDLVIAGVNKNLSLQKVSVTIDEAVKSELVERGYDPRLGARPIRRVVQRTVENIVARRMLSGTIDPGSVISITFDDLSV